jgi:hypothetical protein
MTDMGYPCTIYWVFVVSQNTVQILGQSLVVFMDQPAKTIKIGFTFFGLSKGMEHFGCVEHLTCYAQTCTVRDKR